MAVAFAAVAVYSPVQAAPKAAPKLTDIDEQFGTLDVAGSVYRNFPRGGWDLERRLQDMAASKVDVQVLSVCPQTFLYAQPPAVAASSVLANS